MGGGEPGTLSTLQEKAEPREAMQQIANNRIAMYQEANA